MTKSYYAIIPAKVRYDKSISPNAKLLYGEITALSNAEGYCWAGNLYFAKLYGVSKGTISRWIGSLVKANNISVEMKYKDGSKEIDKRIIGIVDIDNTPIPKNVHTPILKKGKDNTTKSNTTKEKSSISQSPIEWDTLKDAFIKITGKQIRVVSDKVKANIRARLKEGYLRKDIISAIENSILDDYHIETNFKYITLEYISRSKTIDKYFVSTVPGDEEPKNIEPVKHWNDNIPTGL